MLSKLIFLFLLLIGCVGEEPQKVCHPSTPFKKQDQTCGSFNDICLKKDDEDCNYFMKACQQCPPSNYSVLMYIDISNIKSHVNRSNLDLGGLKDAFKMESLQLEHLKNDLPVTLNRIESKFSVQVKVVAACLTFIVLHFLAFFIFNMFEYFRMREKFAKTKKRDEEMETLITKTQTKEGFQSFEIKIETIERIANENYKEIQEVARKIKDFNEENFQRIINENKEKLLQQITQMINLKDENFQRIINEKMETLITKTQTKEGFQSFEIKIETIERIANENYKEIQEVVRKIKDFNEENFQRIINESKEKLLQQITQMINLKDENFQRIINESKETIQNMINKKEYSAFDSVASYKMRFQIANQFDETELFVSKFDSVIKLKKSICDGNMNDYKRMIMKYKDVTLDNNKYLLSCIDSTNIYPIICEFDDNIDVDAMIVIKLKCDNIYPEMLQIWKYQTIKHLKIIISKLNKTNHEDLLIFYKSNQLDDDDKSIDYYKIEDNDSIFVVNKSEEMLNISMKSIFNDKETISIEISKFDKLESIINKSIQKIQHKMVTNHFAVFLNNKLLENEKFIYEYNIDSKSLIEFVYFKSLTEIDDVSILGVFGHIQMSGGRNKSLDRGCLLKAYEMEYMKSAHGDDLSKVLIEDLQMFQITKFHPRFIQMFGIYMDNDWIYIGLENSIMTQMSTFLSGTNKISTYEESKWANQMLEGLKHLHNHNIILKDMNPCNIWINGNHNVKLPCFNMTEYLNYFTNNKDKDNSEKPLYKAGNLMYVAPEILEGKPYDASVDVWSLGVVMIEIVTRGHIYPGLKEEQIIAKIKESQTIEYDKSNKPADLINFIDCCLKYDPKQRSTIDQLMKHEFIEKYLLFIRKLI